MSQGIGGDSDFDHFVAAHWSSLIRAAYMMGRDPADAEDIVQSALTEVFRRWSKISKADDPVAYVYRMVLNAHARAGRRLARRVSDPPSVQPDAAASVDLRLDLRHAVSLLPPQQRAVLVLRYLEDKTEAEISSILNIPAGTVKSRSSRGLEALRAHMVEVPTTIGQSEETQR